MDTMLSLSKHWNVTSSQIVRVLPERTHHTNGGQMIFRRNDFEWRWDSHGVVCGSKRRKDLWIWYVGIEGEVNGVFSNVRFCLTINWWYWYCVQAKLKTELFWLGILDVRRLLVCWRLFFLFVGCRYSNWNWIPSFSFFSQKIFICLQYNNQYLYLYPAVVSKIQKESRRNGVRSCELAPPHP
jgi:hypothetical protein